MPPSHPLPGVHLSSPALSTFKIFPVAAPSPRKLLGYPSSSCVVRGTGEPFPPSARSREVSPLAAVASSLPLHLFLVFLLYTYRAYTTVSRRASSSTSVLLLRLPCSVFRSPRARESFLRAGIFSRDPLLLSGSLATTFRRSRGLKLAETRLVTDTEERGGRKYGKYRGLRSEVPAEDDLGLARQLTRSNESNGVHILKENDESPRASRLW